MHKYLKVRGVTDHMAAELISNLKPKLLAFLAAATREQDDPDDGFGSEVTHHETETTQESTPSFQPFWMSSKAKKLHRTGSSACPWDPKKNISAFEWISSETIARDRALSYCKRCWPTGIDELDSSEDELLLDV